MDWGWAWLCQRTGRLCQVSVWGWEMAPSSAWVSPASSHPYCLGAEVLGRAAQRLPGCPQACVWARPCSRTGPVRRHRSSARQKAVLILMLACCSSPRAIMRHSHALSHRPRDFIPLRLLPKAGSLLTLARSRLPTSPLSAMVPPALAHTKAQRQPLLFRGSGWCQACSVPISQSPSGVSPV